MKLRIIIAALIAEVVFFFICQSVEMDIDRWELAYEIGTRHFVTNPKLPCKKKWSDLTMFANREYFLGCSDGRIYQFTLDGFVRANGSPTGNTWDEQQYFKKGKR